MASDLKTFSAAPSVLGYLYQIRLALLSLLEYTEVPDIDEDRLGVTIEKLDDVAIVEGEKHRFLQQSKNHLDLSGTLTDGSADVWKTLRVWIEASKRPNKSTQLVHCLFTTATAPAGAACALLRPVEGRDVGKAIELLDAAALASESESLKKAVVLWRTLTVDQKNELVKRIQVVDSAPDAAGLNDQISRKLFKHARPPQRAEMLTRLEGWWYQRVVSHLYAVAREQTDVIAWVEVQLKITQIMADFGPSVLPDEYGGVDPDVPVDPDSNDSLFVHQLKAVNATKGSIRIAIRDHWRASEQRSKWLRDLRLLPDELTAYDKRLREEWEHWLEKHCCQIDPTNLARACEAGLKVYQQMLDARFSLRTFNESYLSRGSYHKLADYPAQLGWHPDWPVVCKSWPKLKDKPNESAA